MDELRYDQNAGYVGRGLKNHPQGRGAEQCHYHPEAKSKGYGYDMDMIWKSYHISESESESEKMAVSETETTPLLDKSKKMSKFNTFGSYNENDTSDSFDDVIDSETGEPVKRVWKPKQKRNETALRIMSDFSRRAKSVSGFEPIMGKKEYVMTLRALTTHKLTEQQICDSFEQWFNRSDEKRENIIQITRALSDNRINSYKVIEGMR